MNGNIAREYTPMAYGKQVYIEPRATPLTAVTRSRAEQAGKSNCRWTPGQALAHFFRLGAFERRVYPITLDTDALCTLLALPVQARGFMARHRCVTPMSPLSLRTRLVWAVNAELPGALNLVIFTSRNAE